MPRCSTHHSKRRSDLAMTTKHTYNRQTWYLQTDRRSVPFPRACVSGLPVMAFRSSKYSLVILLFSRAASSSDPFVSVSSGATRFLFAAFLSSLLCDMLFSRCSLLCSSSRVLLSRLRAASDTRRACLFLGSSQAASRHVRSNRAQSRFKIFWCHETATRRLHNGSQRISSETTCDRNVPRKRRHPRGDGSHAATRCAQYVHDTQVCISAETVCVVIPALHRHAQALRQCHLCEDPITDSLASMPSDASKAALAAHLEQKFEDFELYLDPDGALSSSMLRSMRFHKDSWFETEFSDVRFKSFEQCFIRCIKHEIRDEDKQDPATWLKGVYAATSSSALRRC